MRGSLTVFLHRDFYRRSDPLFSFWFGRWPRAKPEGRKELGWVGALPRAAASTALPGWYVVALSGRRNGEPPQATDPAIPLCFHVTAVARSRCCGTFAESICDMLLDESKRCPKCGGMLFAVVPGVTTSDEIVQFQEEVTRRRGHSFRGPSMDTPRHVLLRL